MEDYEVPRPVEEGGSPEETDPTDEHLVHGQTQAHANQSPLYADADDRAPDADATPPDEDEPPADTQSGEPRRQEPGWDDQVKKRT